MSWWCCGKVSSQQIGVGELRVPVSLTDDQKRMLEENIPLAIWNVQMRRRQLTVLRRMPYEDCVQAALVGLARAIKTYDPTRAKLTTYARLHIWAALQELLMSRGVITTPRGGVKSQQIWLDKTRKQVEAAQQRCVSDTELLPLPSREPDHVKMLADRDSVQFALGELPERLRVLIRKRYLEGATHQQVGAVLGVSRNRVAQLEKRALRLMRESLGKEAA